MNADDLKRAAAAAYARQVKDAAAQAASQAAMHHAAATHDARVEEFAKACAEAGPGGAVHLSDGQRLFVGDVNPLGGECDDCRFDPGEGIEIEQVLPLHLQNERLTAFVRDAALMMLCEQFNGVPSSAREGCGHCGGCLSAMNLGLEWAEEDEARERDRRAKDAAFDARLREARPRPVDSTKPPPREDAP